MKFLGGFVELVLIDSSLVFLKIGFWPVKITKEGFGFYFIK